MVSREGLGHLSYKHEGVWGESPQEVGAGDQGLPQPHGDTARWAQVNFSMESAPAEGLCHPAAPHSHRVKPHCPGINLNLEINLNVSKI